MDIVDLIGKTTAHCLLEIAAKNKQGFDKERAKVLFNEQYRKRVPAIVKELQTDANSADLLKNIEQGKVDPLVLQAGKISLVHSCTVWAAELFDQCKN